MRETNANPVVPDHEQSVKDLLKDIDSLAEQTDAHYANMRVHERRKIRMRCEIRFLAPDGATALTGSGVTRDISRGGLGFLSSEHFRRKVPVVVTLHFGEGQCKRLTGTVVFSRRVHENWYLTGMKFAKIEHATLVPGAAADTWTNPPPGADSTGPPGGDKPPTDRKPPVSEREQVLQQLASRTFASRLTRERIDKVVTWSMFSDHTVRRATIPVLMQIGSGVATKALVRLLDDPNHTIQGEAAEALGQVRDTTTIGAIKSLLQHTNEDVALRAALALAQMKDKSGLRVASRILQSDSPLNHRAARTYGVIVDRNFRPNSAGLAAARKYLSANRID